MSFPKKALLGLTMGVVGLATAVGGVRAADCEAPKPVGTPDLFQIDSNGTSATLYWSPLRDNTHGYLISYGASGNEHSVLVNFNDTEGVNKFTINALDPSVGYKFSIRGDNGCMPGEWGNTLRTQGGKGGARTAYFRY